MFYTKVTLTILLESIQPYWKYALKKSGLEWESNPRRYQYNALPTELSKPQKAASQRAVIFFARLLKICRLAPKAHCIIGDVKVENWCQISC